jgi:DNA-binding transcriptional LysR family regulator
MESRQAIGWDDLRLVKAIADGRGLTSAANQLGLNHSTVFRRLGQIETRIGSKLFERHRTGYVLTPVGEEIAALSSRIAEDIDALSLRLSGREPSPQGELRITTNDTLLTNLLMPVLAAFRAQYPAIRLDVVLANQALNLSKRDADVAIRATDAPPETLVGRRVATIQWAIYGRRADWAEIVASHTGDVPESRLAAAPAWVALGDNLGHLKVARYARSLVPPEAIGLKVNTVLGLAEAVQEGVGIGHLPCFIADRRTDLMRLRSPDPDFATGLWLLTHPELRHSPRVRAFMDVAGAELARYRRMIEGELGRK